MQASQVLHDSNGLALKQIVSEVPLQVDQSASLQALWVPNLTLTIQAACCK